MAAITIPILASPNFDRTVAFYAELGFEERKRWPGEYLIIAHPHGFELHFWLSSEVPDPRRSAGCYVRFDTAAEVEKLHCDWVALGINGGHLRELGATDIGLLEFALLDPHNNHVRFRGALDEVAG